ncbi:hypothetical protein DFH08DRAFT_889257 [Mycena albidolilacea]|uniref:Uncharacterized protein n=1 Tax=Mycena albidolilacea TaxID=1033008 RepID=A0AAD6ZGE4_9AGAR|nr:hypothetical protein DFH08DRAFT_889257 [Mycena albidolilacea]
MWILVPIAYFGNKWGSPTFSVMSNGLFIKNGSAYSFNTLLTPDGQLSQTRYDEVGLAYAGAQYLWCLFFGTALTIWYFLDLQVHSVRRVHLLLRMDGPFRGPPNIGGGEVDVHGQTRA